MVDIEIIKDWINKGDEDFEFAAVNLKERKPFYAQICFHFQQAAEKYLKGFIVAHELEFRRIHDLPVLLGICSAQDPTLEELRDVCEYLNAFYVETRYPVHWPTNFSYDEAERALESAAQIRAAIKERVKLQAPIKA
jgi:HEPN domain-containing protein